MDIYTKVRLYAEVKDTDIGVMAEPCGPAMRKSSNMKVKLHGATAWRPSTAANAQRIDGGARQLRRGRTQHVEPYGSGKVMVRFGTSARRLTR